MRPITQTDLLSVTVGKALPIPPAGGLPASFHLFDPESVLAINAALVTGRPLLLRGEPGTGKSQLARAAAVALKRAFISHTVDARTETRDLLYQVDEVARLAEAQVQGALCGRIAPPVPQLIADPQATQQEARSVSNEVHEQIRIGRFVVPGPLWWGFDHASAVRQAALAQRPDIEAPTAPEKWDETKGTVVLIDELDKADASVPNGLLDALGHRRFSAPDQIVSLAAEILAPLVIVTTNEERALPDAFLRRCWVLHLHVPRAPKPPEHPTELVEWLKARGRAHFREHEASDDLLTQAAEMVARDRAELSEEQSRPATAEYLDLVRAMCALNKSAPLDAELLRALGNLALDKHGERRRRQRAEEPQ